MLSPRVCFRVYDDTIADQGQFKIKSHGVSVSRNPGMITWRTSSKES